MQKILTVTALVGPNGELLGPDGKPLRGPNGEILGADGKPLKDDLKSDVSSAVQEAKIEATSSSSTFKASGMADYTPSEKKQREKKQLTQIRPLDGIFRHYNQLAEKKRCKKLHLKNAKKSHHQTTFQRKSIQR